MIIISLSSYGQKEIEILGKFGYTALDNGKKEALNNSIEIGYNFTGKIGFILGFSNVKQNTFPNQNGSIQTAYYYLSTESANNEMDKEIINNYINKKLENYYSFSSIGLNFGFSYKLLSNTKQNVIIKTKGCVSNQNMLQLYPNEINSNEVLVSSISTNFTGIGYSFGLAFDRNIYKSLAIGAFAEAIFFNRDFATDYYNLGIYLIIKL